MHLVYTLLGSLAVAAGVVGTLMILVMLMAGGANSTPQQITTIKWLLAGFSAAGLVCLVGGIVLIARSFPITGGAVGVLPMVLVFAGLIWFSVFH